MATPEVIYARLRTRQQRAEFVADRFRDILTGSLLDVGCDQKELKSLLPRCDYMGIDVAGEPDITMDLEHSPGLPFSDHEFDVVICSDVLEHLDNLHTVFGELVRVARRHVLISLPNNWVNARRPVGRGKGAVGQYGLPAIEPGDRHKWFFGTAEAIEFLQAQTGLYPISVRQMLITEKPRLWLVRTLRRLRFPGRMAYLNRYAHTVWVVYDKDPASERGRV